MTTVNDILLFLEKLAPQSMKMDWDNVGLLCGSKSKEVKKILVALDPFESVCKDAAKLGADLLITHHPLIFQPVKALTDDTSIGRAIQTLIQGGISAINAHTNLDCAPGGVNDVLAQAVGLQDVQVIAPCGLDEEGRPWGLLRQGTTTQQPLEDFLKHLKNKLGCPGLKYVDGGKPVCNVAVGGGSCGGELRDAVSAGCDTFITADVKYNQFWDAKELGLNLIDAGHFHTENPVCSLLAEKLQTAFPEITVILSENHTDCAKFFF
ncbi:MAG: Nif3-like dinuclear metal center hexameric protein [Oscillospiraceae bacterium]|nr:Nif3-like dinuclear metal center hexameric protein [Oscillospiraceae bacterium]